VRPPDQLCSSAFRCEALHACLEQNERCAPSPATRAAGVVYDRRDL